MFVFWSVQFIVISFVWTICYVIQENWHIFMEPKLLCDLVLRLLFEQFWSIPIIFWFLSSRCIAGEILILHFSPFHNMRGKKQNFASIRGQKLGSSVGGSVRFYTHYIADCLRRMEGHAPFQFWTPERLNFKMFLQRI